MSITSFASLKRFHSLKSLFVASLVLAVGAAGAADSRCTPPGLTVVTDPSNDQTGTQTGQNKEYDITSVQVAEQHKSSGTNFVFTMKVSNLAQLPAGSSRWKIRFTGADGKFYYVRMTKFADSTAPIFEYGTTAAATTNPGCFQATGATSADSNFSADGNIRFVIGADKIGNPAPGSMLKDIVANTQLLQGSSALCGAQAGDVDATTGTVNYSVTANNFCPILPPDTVTGDICTPPGLNYVTDPAGDQTGGPSTNTQYDLRSLGISQPKQTLGVNRLVFTLKVADLSTLPANTQWRVQFHTPHENGTTNNGSYIEMSTDDTGMVSYAHGHVDSSTGNVLTPDGGLDAGTGYTADGTITLVSTPIAFGLLAGEMITGIAPETTRLGGALGTGLFLVIDDANSSLNHEVKPANFCGIVQGGGGGSGGVATFVSTPTPFAARYQNFYAPPESGANGSNGEFNIGYNIRTGKILTYSANGGIVARVDLPEQLNDTVVPTSKLPASCDATWQDVTPEIIAAPQALGDPILWTDIPTNPANPVRTFVSNATTGASTYFAYTDDDGASWINASASPPNNSADHQTIGSGPYPADSPFKAAAAAAGFDHAVYYCAQGQGPATCQRSDNGGASFGTGVPIYAGLGPCFGIHGHVKVAPNGWVVVPVRGCGNGQGYTISKDAGITWTDFEVPGTTTGTWDPSIAIGSDNTFYFCSGGDENGGSYAYAYTSTDPLNNVWTNRTNLSLPAGLNNVAFEEAVAGDGDRAACGYLGAAPSGPPGSLAYTGVWHLYLSSTYDGGKTWQTVNATPGDPVQGAGGICDQGTFCAANPNQRNLLDFNEVTIDKKGYVLFGYDDGCVGDCVADPTLNSYVAEARIARQSGGKPLFRLYDPTEPAAPKNACLSGNRTADESKLRWKLPDHGGSAVTSHRIFRATSLSGFGNTALATTASNTYNDLTADPTVTDYFYKVTSLNATGESVASNIVKLSVTAPPKVDSTCTVPGILVGAGAAGDATDMQASHDLTEIRIAEPVANAGQLAFTMKVGSLATLPPNTLWAVRFTPPTHPAGSDTDYYVGMLTNQTGTVSYVYGTVGVQDLMASSVAVYTQTGSLPLANGSYTTAGLITIRADKSLFENGTPLQNGQFLGAVTGTTRVYSGSSAKIAAGSQDTVNGGNYKIQGTVICTTPPVASLTADKTSGTFPLTVNFIANGSSADPGGSIAFYTLDVGDGSTPLRQNSKKFTQVFNTVGSFTVKLKVEDGRGQLSTNAAEVVITVTAPVSADPTPFTFLRRDDVATSSFITSETVTLKGFQGSLPISINNGGQYRIGSGAFTNAAGQVGPNATLTVRHLSSSSEGVETTTTVSVGGYSTPFTSKTSVLDRIPNSFNFGTQTGRDPGTAVDSIVVVVNGYNTAVPIVAGPDVQYSLNGGAYTSASNKLRPGDSLQLRHTTSSAHLGYTKTYVKVGGVTGYFTTRTK